MTATRLTRSGRSRFLIGLGLIILMFGFVAIFHSSQTQLDESRQQLIRCEQQQEALNARMQAIIEHKFRLERSLEAERKEHLETRQSFEQRAKEQIEQNAKAKITQNLHYDSLNQRYKLLQKEHGDLVEDCSKSKKSHLEVVNSLDTKVKSLQSQLQQVRSLNDKDLEELKTKYDAVVQEKDRLEILLKSISLSAENHKKKISKLTETITEFKNNCNYKPKSDSDPLNSEQIMPSPNAGNNHQQIPSNHPLDKPLVQRSFNEQQLMIPKPLASSEDKSKPPVGAVAENVQQMPPLNSTAKSSTVGVGASANGAETHDVNRHALSVANQPSTPSAIKTKRSSAPANSPHKPPKPIPLGVAPIPENFEYLFSNNNHNDEQQTGSSKASNLQQGGEASNKQDTDNNRYVNVVDELIGKNNENGEQDNGAHEIKDADFNADKNQDENVNNGAEEENNFFEAKAPKDNDNDNDHGDGDDMEVFGMGGHKQNHRNEDDLAPIANGLLDGDNLNNEVAGDQGKEQFADGLHIDEGNEEGEDEDDYSNIAARQQEGPAIRNK